MHRAARTLLERTPLYIHMRAPRVPMLPRN